MVIKFENYIKENAYIDYFIFLYEKSPDSLKKIIDSTKEVEQNPIWHSEGDVYIHTRLVTNRLGNAYPQDKNLLLSGLFHDLGKVETTKWNDIKKSWSANGHEEVSVKIIEQYESWIKEMGGDSDKIKNIVQNHMRIKYIDDFRFKNKIEIVNNPYFDDILKFNSADYGGDGLNVKPLLDMTSLYEEIKEYQKKQKMNKLINSKFNGDLIMKYHPDLSGKNLGNAINDFKEYIKKKYNTDFEKFILQNDKTYIMDEFNLFIK